MHLRHHPVGQKRGKVRAGMGVIEAKLVMRHQLFIVGQLELSAVCLLERTEAFHIFSAGLKPAEAKAKQVSLCNYGLIAHKDLLRRRLDLLSYPLSKAMGPVLPHLPYDGGFPHSQSQTLPS